jgi:hypothetical protein
MVILKLKKNSNQKDKDQMWRKKKLKGCYEILCGWHNFLGERKKEGKQWYSTSNQRRFWHTRHTIV